MTTPLETQSYGHKPNRSDDMIPSLRCLKRMAGLMLALQIATLILILQILFRLPG